MIPGNEALREFADLIEQRRERIEEIHVSPEYKLSSIAIFNFVAREARVQAVRLEHGLPIAGAELPPAQAPTEIEAVSAGVSQTGPPR